MVLYFIVNILNKLGNCNLIQRITKKGQKNCNYHQFNKIFIVVINYFATFINLSQKLTSNYSKHLSGNK